MNECDVRSDCSAAGFKGKENLLKEDDEASQRSETAKSEKAEEPMAAVLSGNDANGRSQSNPKFTVENLRDRMNQLKSKNR